MGKDIVVLLVDDERYFLELVSKRLNRKGLRVLTAEGGQEALDILAKEPADVIILDVLMPGMDGLTTLRAVKRICPSVPVILLTGHASMDTAFQGMQLGAHDVLLKPVAFIDLLQKIEEADASARLSAPQDREPARNPVDDA